MKKRAIIKDREIKSEQNGFVHGQENKTFIILPLSRKSREQKLERIRVNEMQNYVQNRSRDEDRSRESKVKKFLERVIQPARFII